MRQGRAVFLGIISCLLLLAGCGGGSKAPGSQVVLGADTVAIDSLRQLIPGNTAGSSLPFSILIQEFLARQADSWMDSSQIASTVAELSAALSLRSDREWSQNATSSIFRCAHALRRGVSERDSTATAAYLADIRGSIHGYRDTTPLVPLPAAPLFADRSPSGRMRLLADLMLSLFALSPTEAQLVAEFTLPQTPRDETGIASVVKGLVYDSASARKKVSEPPQTTSAEARPDNSALALKYRGSQAIADSIGKHIANLEALYRKELKRRPGMAGTVYLTFRVAASGEVMQVKIKMTQISEREFLAPLLEYAQTIRFGPIPEEVGPMTFDFPFDFKPKS